eukprot:TRINITY_DN8238_c0_g2_i5.p1 TRINITY_DN8238_c0_g2~~TRINITY_DN8238_c0_g2_i5.p1  ORF type:complete len:205 (-),score=42.33 TRINITY_DN8238_c0_g2_i5:588-1202(-)
MFETSLLNNMLHPKHSITSVGSETQSTNHQINDIKFWHSVAVVVHQDMQISLWNVKFDEQLSLQLLCQILTPFPLHSVNIRDNIATLIQQSKTPSTTLGLCVIALSQLIEPMNTHKQQKRDVYDFLNSFTESSESSQGGVPENRVHSNSDSDSDSSTSWTDLIGAMNNQPGWGFSDSDSDSSASSSSSYGGKLGWGSKIGANNL